MECVGFNEFDQVVRATTEICPFVLVKSDDFLAAASLDAVSIAESFMWGFGTVIGFWALSYAVRVAIKTVNKV